MDDVTRPEVVQKQVSIRFYFTKIAPRLESRLFQLFSIFLN